MGNALLLILGVGMLIVGGVIWRRWKGRDQEDVSST